MNTSELSQSQHIQDHESFSINDPNAAWQVQSGLIALCRVTAETDTETGVPQCFFTVNPGEVIFGAQEDDLVALALEPSVVVPV